MMAAWGSSLLHIMSFAIKLNLSCTEATRFLLGIWPATHFLLQGGHSLHTQLGLKILVSFLWGKVPVILAGLLPKPDPMSCIRQAQTWALLAEQDVPSCRNACPGLCSHQVFARDTSLDLWDEWGVFRAGGRCLIT